VIVTIDGPAGAGKSSIAKQVADRLGFEFLDTGALYRAVTLGAIRAMVDLHDPQALVQYSSSVDVQWRDQRVFLNGDDVTNEIRVPTVTDAIRFLADSPPIRAQLSARQREIASGRDLVTEGRDQGTEVFPDAECKIFLTASAAERARRRQQQLSESGRYLSIEEIRKAQDLRDAQDRQRPVGALLAATDAIVIESDGLSQQEVIDRIVTAARNCR
jgi:cytidylate kinase/pantoate ligase/cytidylate kinase